MKDNIKIKLPSGDIKSYHDKITPLDIAEEISISLKKMLLSLRLTINYGI